MYNNLYVTHRPVHDLFDLLAYNLGFASPSTRTKNGHAKQTRAKTSDQSSTDNQAIDEQSEQAQMQERAQEQSQPQAVERTLRPQVHVQEDADGYRLMADMPGASKESIEVEVKDQILTLSAPRLTHAEQEHVKLRYHRSFALPDKVNGEGIQASYDNGVLTLTVPKIPAPHVRIAVQ